MSYHKIISDIDVITIEYAGSDRLWQQLGDIFMGTPLARIQGISPDGFREWNEQRETHRMWRLFFYSAETKTLIIKFPSESHEILHHRIYGKLSFCLINNGLQRQARGMGATTHFMRQNGRLIAAGEGDSSLVVVPVSRKNRFPSVVVETGWPQFMPAVRAKVHWWFDVSQGAVRIVLLAILSDNLRNITVEKWKLSGQGNPRPGATTTRASSASLTIPVLQETVVITRAAKRKNTPAAYQVTGAPLRLEFEDVFLQTPVASQTSIVLDDEFFQLCDWMVSDAE
ncbi:hypothetical protein AK830_g10744 [Neonectria ditissima]|uniref:Uncharacterized protein n=1 Tax=Neonectria ditissima TaxID=78410 RepID=A0A0P7B5Q7_9HYPO|nr:hypothetical protein AK830_g10744 [Neonectria ditissima]